MTLPAVELSTWLSNNTPSDWLWRGYTTAFRSGVLHRMLGLPPGEHSRYTHGRLGSAFLAGFTTLDSYLASGGQLLCPGCALIWSPPSSCRPPLTLGSWLDQTRPTPAGAMLTTAFSAGASARLRGRHGTHVPMRRSGATLQSPFGSPTAGAPALIGSMPSSLEATSFIAPAASSPWFPRSNAPNPSAASRHPIVRLLARLDQITT